MKLPLLKISKADRVIQSQRDCVPQPRVASLRATLGPSGIVLLNPNGVVANLRTMARSTNPRSTGTLRFPSNAAFFSAPPLNGERAKVRAENALLSSLNQ